MFQTKLLVVVLLVSCFYAVKGFFPRPHGWSNSLLTKHHSPKLDSLNAQTIWIKQPLNHFDENDDRKFQMRYLATFQFWKPAQSTLYISVRGGPENGEIPSSDEIIYQLANETGGAMFYTEHRYYGQSKPLKTNVNDTESEYLSYLSSKQALRDIKNIVEDIKSSPDFESSKVVLVGSGYGGNLATWVKKIYPELVDASIAIGAPILAKTEFVEFHEKLSEDYERYGTPGCYDKIIELFQLYENMMQTDDGIKKLREEDNICSYCDMYARENQQLFFLKKLWTLAEVIYNRDTYSIKEHCEEIKNGTLKNIGWNERSRCNIYDYNTELQSIYDDPILYPWIYQTCSEFGYFTTSTADDAPMTNNFPVEYFFSMCGSLFGSEFGEERVNRGVEETNVNYGGLYPNVTNVVFVTSELDPWSRLSIVESVPSGSKAVFIPAKPHSSQSYAMYKDDKSDDLKDPWNYVKYIVKKWIGLA